MAGITLAQAEAKLTEYLAAESKILFGQKIEIDGKNLTRADLEDVQLGVAVWEKRVQRLSRTGGGMMIREVIPR